MEGTTLDTNGGWLTRNNEASGQCIIKNCHTINNDDTFSYGTNGNQGGILGANANGNNTLIKTL